LIVKGLVQIYTGPQNEAPLPPLGLSLRAAGHGYRTQWISLSSLPWGENAIHAACHLSPYLKILPGPIPFGNSKRAGDENAVQFLTLLEKARQALSNTENHLVVVNGILQLLERRVISLDTVLDLIRTKPDHVELVLPGQGKSDDLLDVADLVTELVPRKKDLSSDCTPGEIGSIQVITGNGKGKTTYCLGKALLTSSMQMPCIIIQFIKSARPYGETRATERLPCIELKSVGVGFVGRETGVPDKKHRVAAVRAWEQCLEAIFSMKYDLVVLDEINMAIHYGLLNPEKIMQALFKKPKRVNVLLSGRHAHPALLQGATSVIEMTEIKHPYRKGIHARKGIEY
jgi:cob(I)alamin adenosyltransferase